MTTHFRADFFCRARSLPAKQRLGALALRTARFIFLLLALLQATAHTGPLALRGRIVDVTDGDTVTLLDEHQTLHKIRLAGIDAPESGMPYGQKATAQLAALVFGQNVLAHTRKQDRYGRTVAILWVGARDANLAMLQVGLAWHYKHYAAEQPATEAQAYAQAEEQARANGLGLWQDRDPTAPWDWRRSRRAHSSQSCGATIPGEMALRSEAAP